MRSFFRPISFFALLACASFAMAAPPNTRPLSPAQQARVVEGYGKLPLSFEPNQGQADPQIKFLSRGDGYSLSLTSSEAVLSLPGKHCSRPSEMQPVRPPMKDTPPCAESPDSVLLMTMLGSNPNSRIDGREALPGKSNYFLGQEPIAWHTNIANYRKVQYHDVYPGIDLVYYGNQRQLEHDFIVAPGADPNLIRLKFTGAKRLSIDRDGNLKLYTDNGVTQLKKPDIYQDLDGTRKVIAGRYIRKSADEIGFALTAYDRNQKLVIDPVLVYSTYLGGSRENHPSAIAADSEGNLYVAGYTLSADFPLSNPIYFNPPAHENATLGFITKISADGSTLIYSTYLGPATANTVLSGIALDGDGSVYVTGTTRANDYPVVNAFQSERRGNFCAVVTKLNPTGSALEYSSYLGGDSGAEGVGIAVDAAHAAYVTGYASPDGSSKRTFPLVNPFSTVGSIFLSKVSPAGSSLEYSTRVGGQAATDDVQGIAVDSLGEAIISGYSGSSDFPLRSPLPSSVPLSPYDYTIFVAKLTSTGSDLVFSTFLGRGLAYGVATDASGDAFVAGQGYNYQGGDIPLFVARIKSSGSELVYSTAIPSVSGNGGGDGNGIAVDKEGNAYVSGSIDGGFPLLNPSLSSQGGNGDASVVKLDPKGSILFSAALGGSGFDYGSRVAIDGRGNIYLAGQTYSPDFPLKAALQTKRLTDVNRPTGFIAKISELAPFTVTVDKAQVSPGGDLHYTINIVNTETDSGIGLLTVASTRARFHTCQVSNGDPCQFVSYGGRASVRFTPIAKEESRTISIYATAAETAGDYNLIPLTANLKYYGPPHLTYSAAVSTTVRETADIAIASSLVDSTNGLLHYVHTVTNLGPDNAHAVLLLDPLPTYTSYVSASTTAGKCSFHPTIGAHGSVRCTLDNPKAGGIVTVNVVLQADRNACPSITNTATITSQSIDADNANDSSSFVAQLPESFCGPPPPTYQLTYLALPAYQVSPQTIFSLNNKGDLLASDFGQNETFINRIYRAGSTTPINLPFGGGFLNDSDDLLTSATVNGIRRRGIYKNGAFQAIDFGAPNEELTMRAFNNLDQIAGDRYESNGSVPFIYENGKTRDIGHYVDGEYGVSTAINDKGEVTVVVSTETAVYRPQLLYTHGLLLPITAYSAVAIDSSGRVTGNLAFSEFPSSHVYIYSAGKLRDLYAGDGRSLVPADINDCGELVGGDEVGGNAFLYKGGRYVDLNALISLPNGLLLRPKSINNRGQILAKTGLYRDSDSPGPSVLLTPTGLEKCGSDATIDNNPDSATITAGGTITYTIKAANLDTATTQFTVNDELDPTTTVLSCTVIGGGGTCNAVPGSHAISASLPNLAKGSTATITIKVKAADTYSAKSIIMNTATLSSALTSDYLSTAYTSVP